MKLYLVRAMNNYFRMTHVAAENKPDAAAKGQAIFGERCTAAEVKVPGWLILLEPAPRQRKQEAGQ